MGNLARRLRTLEGRSGTPERKREESRAVLSRMTDDELEDYEELLEATTEPGGDPADLAPHRGTYEGGTP